MADYNSSLTAQEIESTLLGAVVHNKQTYLSEQQKAQARKNIGAGSSDNGMKILGFFSTLDDLKAGVPNPSAGDAYGVGESYPYNIYIWDGLHSMWVNNGNIRGADGNDGEDGADAVITPESVESGLGYIPGMVNPNLLDNWYFGNPVNQRGITSGTSVNKQYGLDRWIFRQNGNTFALNSNGFTLTPAAVTNATIEQKLADPTIFVGKNLTMSILFADGDFYFGTITRTASVNQNFFAISNITAGQFTAENSIFIRTYVKKTIVAVKLELGSVQTLARHVNGEWVLNEIPDYGEQLARCQRYFQRFENNSGSANYPLSTGVAHNTTTLQFCLELPVAMRAYPVISVSDISAIQLNAGGGTDIITATSLESAGAFGIQTGFVQRGFNVVASNLIAKQAYTISLVAGAYLDLIADL